jgi:lipoate-protein ligase A
MGVDEALLASSITGVATLRFYSWEGPWLSLGYAQQLPAARIEACAKEGVCIVRRVTGGRAVLHGGDLTYCVAAPEVALPPGLRGSYRLVADALIAGLRSLGVSATRSAGPVGASGPGSFDCFAVAAEDEVCVRGHKLAGNAQRRARGGVLQHGSIRLVPDPPPAARAAGLTPGVATSLAELGGERSIEEVREALVTAFQGILGSALEDSDLTATERRTALQRVEAYADAPLASVRIP